MLFGRAKRAHLFRLAFAGALLLVSAAPAQPMWQQALVVVHTLACAVEASEPGAPRPSSASSRAATSLADTFSRLTVAPTRTAEPAAHTHPVVRLYVRNCALLC